MIDYYILMGWGLILRPVKKNTFFPSKIATFLTTLSAIL